MASHWLELWSSTSLALVRGKKGSLMMVERSNDETSFLYTVEKEIDYSSTPSSEFISNFPSNIHLQRHSQSFRVPGVQQPYPFRVRRSRLSRVSPRPGEVKKESPELSRSPFGARIKKLRIHEKAPLKWPSFSDYAEPPTLE